MCILLPLLRVLLIRNTQRAKGTTSLVDFLLKEPWIAQEWERCRKHLP
jgi:hypothetical protein